MNLFKNLYCTKITVKTFKALLIVLIVRVINNDYILQVIEE